MPYVMMMVLLFVNSIQVAWSQDDFTYVSPHSTILKQADTTIEIKTRNNTRIKLLLDTLGKLESAEGVNLNRGDIFTPGQGILPLSQVEERMKKLGIKIYGRWSLIKFQEYGWVYKLNVAVKGDPIFHLVNAYSGQIIGTMTKFAPPEVEGQVAKD